jgi:hypothetical protein
VRRATAWVVVLVTAVAAMAGCESDDERARAVRDQVLAVGKTVPGVARLAVTTRVAAHGVAVDAEATLEPAAGRTAEDVKRLRDTLIEPAEVLALTLKLVVKRGAAEHDGRWYDGTAALPRFERQADLWGATIDAGGYRRVVAMMQSTTRFQVSAQGWAGSPGTRPSASAAYRVLVTAARSAGLPPEELELRARPTDRMEVAGDGSAALSPAVLAATDRLGELPGVTGLTTTGRAAAPHVLIRVYPRVALTAAQRARVLGTLRTAGLLGPDLQVFEGSGTRQPLWPTAPG